MELAQWGGVATHPRKQPPPAETRERLLAQARCLFVERGYANTSVADIVEAASVTKPTLYYHFKNKEAIYRAIVGEAIVGFLSVLHQFEEEAPGMDPPSALRTLVDRVFSQMMLHVDAARLICADMHCTSSERPPIDKTLLREEYLRIVRVTIRRGIRSGVWDGPVPLLTGMVVGLIDAAIAGEVRPEPVWRPGRKGLRAALDIAMRGWSANEHK